MSFRILIAAEVNWSNWGSWNGCSKSCGGGRSSRRRSCIGGRVTSCSGVSVDERLCNSNACPGGCGNVTVMTHTVCFLPKGLFTAEASWSTWGSWSSCTKTCGRGRSDRYRSCSGGSTCPGDGSEARWCNNNSCPGHLTKQSYLPVKSTSLYLS